MWIEVIAARRHRRGRSCSIAGGARYRRCLCDHRATEAHDWATKPTNPVSGGEYSAYYWAQVAESAAGAVEGTAYPLLDGTRPFTGKQTFVAPATGRASIVAAARA